MTPAPPSPPEVQEFPTYRLPTFLPPFLLGWGVGAVLTFTVRAAGGALLGDPCEGRTLLALLLPLLLGPGGLALTAANWRRPRRAALGLGLVVASLLPALYVGAQDIGELRRTGCAGGYVVVSRVAADGQPGGSISSLRLEAGSSVTVTARVGGYTTQTHPGVFTVQAQTAAPGVTVTPGRTQVRVGEDFPVTVTVPATTPVNTYTIGIGAREAGGDRPAEAAGTLELNVRPAPGTNTPATDTPATPADPARP